MLEATTKVEIPPELMQVLGTHVQIVGKANTGKTILAEALLGELVAKYTTPVNRVMVITEGVYPELAYQHPKREEVNIYHEQLVDLRLGEVTVNTALLIDSVVTETKKQTEAFERAGLAVVTTYLYSNSIGDDTPKLKVDCCLQKLLIKEFNLDRETGEGVFVTYLLNTSTKKTITPEAYSEARVFKIPFQLPV